jgi:copper(I)-binding protein
VSGDTVSGVDFPPPTAPFHRAMAAALAAASATALAGCGGGSSHASSSPTPSRSTLTVSDAWVKAAPAGSTDAYGVLHNAGNAPLTVISAASNVSAGMALERSRSDGTPQDAGGGLVVPAHGSLALTPDGPHIAFQNVAVPIVPGDGIPISLKVSDGSVLTFAAMAKGPTG